MGIFSFRENVYQYRKAQLQLEVATIKRDIRKKKKLTREIEDQRKISRRALLKLGFGLGVIGIGGTGTIMGSLHLLLKEPKFDYNRKPMVPMDGIAPFPGISEGDLEKSMRTQLYWKSVALVALENFRNADPRVPVLIKFMQEKAYYSIPMGPKVTKIVTQNPEELMALRKDSQGFEVVFMPEQYAGQMPSSILTEPEGTMRIATNFKLQQWLGIMLAHELSHEYDLKVNGENPFAKDEYVAGEVKAHLLEMKLLESWDPKSYELLLKYGIPLWEAGNIESLTKLIASLYPVTPEYVSIGESILGMASCVTAIAFEHAQRKGAGIKELEAVYVNLRKRFHGG